MAESAQLAGLLGRIEEGELFRHAGGAGAWLGLGFFAHDLARRRAGGDLGSLQAGDDLLQPGVGRHGRRAQVPGRPVPARPGGGEALQRDLAAAARFQVRLDRLLLGVGQVVVEQPAQLVQLGAEGLHERPFGRPGCAGKDRRQ